MFRSMRTCLRCVGCLALALLLSVSFGAGGLAYTALDTAKTGSITVTPQSGESIGTSLTLYRVADIVVDNADQKYVLTESFSGSGADLTSLDEAEKLAQTLSAYAAENGLTGETKAVGSDGAVKFENLSLGLYLVLQNSTQEGKSVVSPFLVSVPGENDDGTWNYDVQAEPKAEGYEVVDVTVKKVWSDSSSSSRPGTVSVSLYRGDTLVATVSLSASNSWTYTWSGLEKSDSYQVKEAAVSGYTAAYSQSGNVFTVTNTYTSSTLVQTGQLNWPVPVLAGGGVLLFAIGWALVFLKKDGSE